MSRDSLRFRESPYSGIARLEQLPLWDGNQFSPIEVPRILLERLDNPQDKIPAIHVAGTNGKGSTCALLSAALLESGARVGQFASPHLVHVTERCLVNGTPVSYDCFSEAVEEVLDLAAELGLATSYFVVTTVASFLIFARAQLDWAVIEVGLGGLYDATNLMKQPRASLITSISLEHMHMLGDSIEEIAENKAGIIRGGTPLFVGYVPVEARGVIELKAREHGTPAYFLEDGAPASVPTLALQGAHQRNNAALALRVLEYLEVSSQAIEAGFAKARWPGRMEEFVVTRNSFLGSQGGGGSSRMLLDAAHNPEGVGALVEHLREEFLGPQEPGEALERIVFLISILERKAWKEMLDALASFSGAAKSCSIDVDWVFSPCSDESSLVVEKMREHIGRGHLAESPRDGLVQALSLTTAAERSLIVALGSIFFIGDVRPLVCEELFRTYY